MSGLHRRGRALPVERHQLVAAPQPAHRQLRLLQRVGLEHHRNRAQFIIAISAKPICGQNATRFSGTGAVPRPILRRQQLIPTLRGLVEPRQGTPPSRQVSSCRPAPSCERRCHSRAHSRVSVYQSLVVLRQLGQGHHGLDPDGDEPGVHG